MRPARLAVLIRRSLRVAPRSNIFPNEYVIATPTMKTKNGKIRSVGVQPFQGACFSGG
jgi:hypothetical protein